MSRYEKQVCEETLLRTVLWDCHDVDFSSWAHRIDLNADTKVVCDSDDVQLVCLVVEGLYLSRAERGQVRALEEALKENSVLLQIEARHESCVHDQVRGVVLVTKELYKVLFALRRLHRLQFLVLVDKGIVEIFDCYFVVADFH